MADTSIPEIDGIDPAPKDHFNKAVEEAKAGAQALGKQAQDVAGTYRDKLAQTTAEVTSDARIRGDEAMERAMLLANEGKARASGAVLGLGKMVEDNASAVDERMGVTYGDYVRTAGRSLQDLGSQLENKEYSELAADFQELVRKSPAMAIGLAAAGGFMLSRLFKSTKD